MESAHPYTSNLNETIILSIPKAQRITVEFAQQTATETTYDYVIFWRDESRTSRWHDEPERLVHHL
jgi:hypothetical protein